MYGDKSLVGRKALFGRNVGRKPDNEFKHRPGQWEKCVIFDFDGTVADTYGVALKILHDIAESRRTEPPKDIESLRMMSAAEIIRKYRLSVVDLILFEKKYEDGVYRRIRSIRPFAGLKAVLRKLDRSYGLGIISSNRRENVFAFLHNTGLDKYFDFLETGSPLLGKARRINAIMKKHGYRKSDVVYVGDEVRDIEAAKKVGIKVIAVGWGFNSTKRLKAARPSFFVSRPAQLVRVAKAAVR
ncbi:MAG: HAD-IA family hydrolase [Candidatus Aenigmatarchaeota archaeon]